MFKLEKANAYSALIGAAAGTLGTLVAAVFFLGGQWERWTEIRDAHIQGNVVNETIDLTPFANAESLPNFSDFALKADIPDLAPYAKSSDLPSLVGYARSSDIPNVSGLARRSEIPDVTGFLTTAAFNDFQKNLGAGETSIPKQHKDSSTLCTEGSVMVGAEYHIAGGDNAGALYSGIAPICRSLTR